MPYREDEDALRARVDSLEHEASDEHAENERLRAELARVKDKHATPARDAATADDRTPKSTKRRKLRVVAISVAPFAAVLVACAIGSCHDGVHGTIYSEGGKLGTWQVEVAKCQSRGHRFDGLNFYDGNGVNRARMIVDAKGDAYLWVYKDDEKNWGYRAERKDCTTLDANMTLKSSGHRRDVFDGALAFDCKLADGRVHGSLTFQGCY